MSFIFSCKINKKAKLYASGSTLDLLTITVGICKAVAEKIAEEKGLELEQAIRHVSDSLIESYTTIQW